MSDIQGLLGSLPIDQFASRLGETPDNVRAAAAAALPALVGGLQANAAGGGVDSLLSALDQHTGDVDAAAIDTADGAKAVGHIFGAQQDAVVNKLAGASGVSSGLVQKLLPMLAPIVLGWLAKQMTSKGGGGVPSAIGGGLLGSILERVLTGGAQGGGAQGGGAQGGGTAPAGGSPSASGGLGSIVGDVLGGLLGGGRR